MLTARAVGRPPRRRLIRLGGHLATAGSLLALSLAPVALAPAVGVLTPAMRVSVSSAGDPGNADSTAPSVSADGRFVAFESDATNLVSGDRNRRQDVFVHDRQTGVTERVSVSSTGGEGNGHSGRPAISADGRFVAFESLATNLVPGDTNRRRDIFVRDRQMGVTERVSVSSAGAKANGHSEAPAISADGRFVAFASDATNLVEGDTNRRQDVFVHDRWTHQTFRISLSSPGEQGNGRSSSPAISADGRVVAFESAATNLVTDDTNRRVDVFVRDWQSGQTVRVSVSTSGDQGNGDSGAPAISADGTAVAFESEATNFVVGDTTRRRDIFVHDRLALRTERVSVSNSGEQGNGHSETPAISADGRFVVFVSLATNLVAGDDDRVRSVFVHDRDRSETARVNLGPADVERDQPSEMAVISGDGHTVAFVSRAAIPGAEDANRRRNVFVVERNLAPVVQDDGASTLEGTPIAVDVLENDDDPDGDALTVTAFTQGASGGVRFAGGIATYTPNPGFRGDDQFTYTVSDGHGGTATATVRITVGAGAPTVTGFTPTSGRAGRVLTLTGTNLGSTRRVLIDGVSAPFTVISPTRITVTVPAGAQTGPIVIETAGGTVTTPGHLVVLPSSDFALSAVPSTATALQGGQANYALDAVGVDGFTGLVSLAVSGLPSGVTSTLIPGFLAPGQRGTLVIQVAGDAATATSTFSVTGTATVNGSVKAQTVPLSLTVSQGGRTALTGRFLVNDGSPLPGVQLRLDTLQATTNAAGAFLFLDPPAGLQQLMVDANAARTGFPIYGIDVTIVAGRSNTLPDLTITPPPPPERFTPIANATQGQTITNPEIPEASITLPAGVTLVGWDGSPKTQIAIDRLNVDQLPMPPPPFETRSFYRVSFGTPMGGLPSAPLPVTAPNDGGYEPGEKAEIWYYDASPLGGPAAWRLAGLGTVSADGRRVVADPGVGIQRFCGVCGVFCIVARALTQLNILPEPFGLVLERVDSAMAGAKGGEPVDLATGLFTSHMTDLVLSGRLPVNLARTFNALDPFGRIAGFELGLGPGWTLSVDVVLLEITPTLRRIILPGNSRFDFVRQAEGHFVNTTHAIFAGAVLVADGTGAHRLRFKDGETWRFVGGFLSRTAPLPITGLGLLIEQTNRNGNRVTIERDQFGGLVRLAEPSGRSLNVTSDPFTGRITQVTDPIDRQVQYRYDARGRLESVTNPAGGVTRYTYDAAGRILTITDPRSINFLQNEYNLDTGRVLRQTQADGGVWTFQYQLQGATVRDPAGNVTQPPCPPLPPSGVPRLVCDAFRPVESLDAVAAGFAFSGGSVQTTAVTDPRGNPTTHTFTPDAFPREIADAFGQTTRFERDAAGRLLSMTDPLGRTTRFTYDPNGNQASITNPAGHVQTFTYDPIHNQVTSITDPLGSLTTFQYDAKGNRTAVIDPAGNTSRTDYDDLGQAVRSTDALSNAWAATYDAHGNLLTMTDPLGNATRRVYDAVSRRERQVDARGAVTHFTYDPLDRVTAVTDAMGKATAATYDFNGNILTLIDGRNNIITYEYDTMNRLTRWADALGNAETFRYDQNGNLISTTDRKGQTSTFTYDALNRLVRSIDPAGVAAFEYEAIGNLIQADDTADPHRPIIREYDVLKRLVSETTALGTVRYGYDAAGRRTTMLVGGQAPVIYTYDGNSNLRTISQVPLAPVDLQYDGLNRRRLLTLPNGVSTEYRYDTASRLTALIYRNGAGPLGDLSYHYDPSGRRVAVGGSFARTAVPEAVAGVQYDAANRQLGFGTKTMTFDRNGNLETLNEPTGLTNFTWDARNRMTSVTGPGFLATYGYDALSRRARKTVNAKTTVFQYDEDDAAHEIRGGTDVGVVRSLQVDELFVEGGQTFPLQDALGNTVALTDGAGRVVATYAYDPYGGSSVVGENATAYQYTGREADADTLYYYRARYYSPVLTRFVQEDPTGLGGGDPNFYRYVGGDPVNVKDPTGLGTTQGTDCAGEVLVTRLNGRVEVRRFGETVWSPVFTSTVLREGDWVRTDFNSLAKLYGCGGRSSVKLYGNSMVERFEFGPPVSGWQRFKQSLAQARRNWDTFLGRGPESQRLVPPQGPLCCSIRG